MLARLKAFVTTTICGPSEKTYAWPGVSFLFATTAWIVKVHHSNLQRHQLLLRGAALEASFDDARREVLSLRIILAVEVAIMFT